MPWSNNDFAILHDNKLSIWYVDDNKVLHNKYRLHLGKSGMGCRVKPFPDGKHFLCVVDKNSDVWDLYLVSVENGKTQYVGILYSHYHFGDLPYTQLFHNKLIVSNLWEARGDTSWVYHLDFNKKNWIVKTDYRVPQLYCDQIFFSHPKSSIFAVYGSTIYENTPTKFIETEAKDCNFDKFSKMSPRGYIFHRGDKGKFNFFRLFNCHSRKDFNLEIKIEAQNYDLDSILVAADDHVEILKRSEKGYYIETYHLSPRCLIAETYKSLPRFAKEITDIVSGYAYSFFAVHDNFNSKLKKQIYNLQLHIKELNEEHKIERNIALYNLAALNRLKELIEVGNKDNSTLDIVQTINKEFPGIGLKVKGLLMEFSRMDFTAAPDKANSVELKS